MAYRSPELKAIVDRTNQHFLEKVDEISNYLQQEVKNAPKDQNHFDTWRRRGREKYEQYKRELSSDMDKPAEDAIAQIRQLPDRDQGPAAASFSFANDFVVRSLSKVLEFFYKSWEAIVGNWRPDGEWVNRTIDAVKSWATATEQDVKDAFPKIADSFRLPR